MNRKASGILLILFSVSIIVLTSNIQQVKARTWTVDDNGPADFHKIQDAINAASNGDTILVKSGTYLEHPDVNKSVSLEGENPITTIIDGNHEGNVVEVTADQIILTGFSIRNSGQSDPGFPPQYKGVEINNAEDCSFSGNSITACENGIILSSSSHNTISGNKMDNTYLDIGLGSSSSNNITKNTLTGATFSNGITIGISSNDNYVSANTILAPISIGLTIFYASSNTIIGNNISAPAQLLLQESFDNNITENNIDMILIWIPMSPPENNNIYHNNLNETDVPDIDKNSWDDGYPSGGNYWSDYGGVDENGDGIGDTPYIINANNVDHYPLMSPWCPAFDFGTSSSPVKPCYAQVTQSTEYSAALGYGWNTTVGLASRDRGAPDNLERDLVFSSTDHTFNVDLISGQYTVTLIIGDSSYTHDLIDVYAEDVLEINHLTVGAGTFSRRVFVVTVSDGQLNIGFHDAGGSDANWVINAVRVEPFVPFVGKYDFGTGGSPVEPGYVQVTESTTYSAVLGYGWDSTVGLASRDRGAPDYLERDFVFSGADHTFNVDLPNGQYKVTLMIVDSSYTHDLMDIYVEGVLQVNHLTVSAGTFNAPQVFTVTVSDGQLNIRFHDAGGSDPNWVINAIKVEQFVPIAQRFDFGTGGSPVEPGYVQVTESTGYSAVSGYGWDSTVGLASRDRGAPDNLQRDFVFSGTDRTFNVDLANGNYKVTLVIGDYSYTHDLIDVYAENVLHVNHLTVGVGTFSGHVFIVTVSDGQLNIRFHDAGGSDGNWVINAIRVEPFVPFVGKYDFGTGGSPVEPGYVQVTESTGYSAVSGYGWDSAVGLASRDRGAPDNLQRDFVFSGADRTFNVDLENAQYRVTLTIGDNDFKHDLIDVYVENVFVKYLTVNAGEFSTQIFEVTVSDGQLNIRFHDAGGSDLNWVINAITIQYLP